MTILRAAMVDWQSPWWAGWQSRAQAAWQTWEAEQAPLSVVLNRLAPDAPVRFVPQAALPEGQAYEAFIHAQRQVPTRDNLHDLLNACCWCRFPRTKSRLNALQGEVIAREGIRPSRGPVRDALTLFDENAVLLQAPAEVWEALGRRDWRQVFVDRRASWADGGSVRAVVFGHALLEKLCQPYKSVTAHAYWIDPSVAAGDAAWDAWLDAHLSAEHLATKPFHPLPVMGIPGWCEVNASASFYDDVQVFRPLPLG